MRISGTSLFYNWTRWLKQNSVRRQKKKFLTVIDVVLYVEQVAEYLISTIATIEAKVIIEKIGIMLINEYCFAEKIATKKLMLLKEDIE